MSSTLTTLSAIKSGETWASPNRDVIRLIGIFRDFGLYVSSVVLTRYHGQSLADAFQSRLEGMGIRVYHHYDIPGYPSDTALVVSEEGFGKNDYIETTRELVVVTAPGPGSGKLATCLSQLYHEHCRLCKVRNLPHLESLHQSSGEPGL